MLFGFLVRYGFIEFFFFVSPRLPSSGNRFLYELDMRFFFVCYDFVLLGFSVLLSSLLFYEGFGFWLFMDVPFGLYYFSRG
uniref:Ribosomal protein S12 n=1 Tax=Perkinsela sp. GillNOR1/I TaxID=1766904 RepID=A0A0U2SRJ5_9EUGL|nr:ribosomal protein S12 [Perkinsela sp. GillNOR1/I]